MRHAKAEPFASSDHARVLTDRGHGDAAAAGTWLRELGDLPDHAIVSTAARTRETWADVVDASGADAEASFDEALYHGGVDEALEALQAVPEDATSVIFVGHNPTAAYLSHHLDDGDGDEAAISGMLQGFPTSALVILDVAVRWSQLAAGAGRVVAFHAPRH
ncbi:MAG: histidine phosphatase family protein [Nocardioides sp.]